MSERTVRNSSIELLRIIALMGIVVLHYNNGEIGGGFKFVEEGSLNQYYLYFTENLFVCAVDLFIMISAYYLCTTKQRRLIKIVELMVQVIAFRTAVYLIPVVLGAREFSVKILFWDCILPVNYFVILYSVLYILSPYINLLIENLDKKNFRKLVIILMVIFSAWNIGVDYLENIYGEPLDGLSTVGMYGSQYGYSIVNFVLVYFVGAYIRISDIKVRKKTISILMVFTLLILYVISLIEHNAGLLNTSTWNYNNPLIIFFAALILLLFVNISFRNKVINE